MLVFYTVIFVLPAGLYSLLRSPWVQNYLSQRVASYLSSELQTTVTVGGINVAFFLDLVLEDVLILDKHNNTLLYTSELKADIENIDFEEHRLSLGGIRLDNAFFALMKYKNEDALNLQFIIDYFSPTDSIKTKNPNNWLIDINSVALINTRFVYNDQNKNRSKGGMDYGYIDVSNINLYADQIYFRGDTVDTRIVRLTATEKCGFMLNSFSSNISVSSNSLSAKSTHFNTPNSNISLDLLFSFDDWKDFNAFEQNVFMTGTIRNSLLNAKDIGYFAPELKLFDESFLIQGLVSGKVDSLTASNLEIKYASKTYLSCDATITGLPDIYTSYITADIKSFTTHYSDIAGLDVPNGSGKLVKIDIPKELSALGNINLKGRFSGYYNDFNAIAKLDSDLGFLDANINMKGDEINPLHTYSGKVITENFNIGALLNIEDMVGVISMDANISGSGFTKETAELDIKGEVFLFGFKQYSYNNITVDGQLSKKVFNGKLMIKDENLIMDFAGFVDFCDSIPVYDFTAGIGFARLNKINLIRSDSITDISCNIKAHFKGTNADNISGNITIEDATYKDGNQFYNLDYLRLTAQTELLNYRTFNVKSDYVDAEFKGTFYFDDIVLSVKKFIVAYLPGLTFKNDSLNKQVNKQDFNFDITFFNATPVLKYFISDLDVSQNTRLTGDFNSITNKLNFNFKSAECTYQKMKFYNIYSIAKTKDDIIDLRSGCSKMYYSDSIHIDSVQLLAKIKYDSINFNLAWDNKPDTIRNAANIGIYITFSEKGRTNIGINSAWFIVQNTSWDIYTGGDIIIDSIGGIIPGVYLTSGQQRLEIKGRMTQWSEDKIRGHFVDFNLSCFDYITDKLGFDLNGIVNGYVDVNGALGQASFTSNLYVQELAFNSSVLGNATIDASWDKVNKGVDINAKVLYGGGDPNAAPISVTGYYFPDSKKNNFALNIFAKNFELKSLSRYLQGTATILEGKASGSFILKGMASDPELIGKASLMRACFRIDYLNTIFSTTHDEVLFDKNNIWFKNLVLHDQPIMLDAANQSDLDDPKNRNFALCNGKIHHEKFSKWSFDLNLKTDKFFCLNTSSAQNELFYGKAFASGNVHIYGSEKNVQIDLDVKTERNTRLCIPMDYTSEVSENNYIIFISKDSTVKQRAKSTSIAGVQLSCKFQVTDDAEVQIIFDPLVGDRISGRGNGNITMEITNDGKFKMSGEYIVKSGDYLFTFENVLNKRFILEEGGTIAWTGDPYDAVLDIRAVYHLKASPSSLGFESNKGSVPVDCIINMSGLLMNPTFTFEIGLPGMNDLEKSIYLAAINQNLNYNFLTLLVVNSFYNPGVSIAGNNSQTSGSAGLLGKTSSEVLSNQMSNWLSQISKDLDIGVNYRPGDQITQQEVEVALSTQLLNDRLKIESNVGLGGGLVNSQSKNSSNIVGDVNIEVKLTDETRLHVFNKSNQMDYLVNDVLYTQGIGVFYRREFNTTKELFEKRKKKEKKKK